jgi:uncharacterized protein YndB with AHSA1/START domain
MSDDLRLERLFDVSPEHVFDALADHTDARKGADDG